MNISLYDNVKPQFDYQKVIENITKTIKEEITVSLILVDINDITQINREYRNKDYPTDVISFEEEDEEDETYIGDIFICVEKIAEQAAAYKHSLEREFAFLIVHGILHLLGYDHMEKEDEEIMFAKQEEILLQMNYKRS